LTHAADILADIERGETPAYVSLNEPGRDLVIADLLAHPSGRRWLRGWPELDADLAGQLLAYDDDFQQQRRDSSLAAVVRRAPLAMVEQHAGSIATGSAASALWERLATSSDRLVEVAAQVVASGSPAAAESTLYLLVIDPLDPYRLSVERRAGIAEAALSSSSAEVRGAGAEFLGTEAPSLLVDRFDALITDTDERVRGVVWLAALRSFRRDAFERAIALLGDESVAIPVRRSALVAIGTQMPTSDMIDILNYLVVHPDPTIAEDAASLLYSHHRNPITAEAARLSPHANVREIAETLLDPLRGSPAAGGSRPGDPTRTTDIFREMVEHLEARTKPPEDEPDSQS
jgi:hypothetical protein